MARKTFADALKTARLAEGLSQAELARRAGLTGSYISVLESRRRRPPSPRVVRALAKALGIEDGRLQEAAALERAPPTVRRSLERMRRERGKVHRTRDRLLTTTLFHLSRRPKVIDPLSHFLDLEPGQHAVLAALLGRLRKVKSLDEAEARTAEVLEGTSVEEREALVRTLPEALASDPAISTHHPVAPSPYVGVPLVEDPGPTERIVRRLLLDRRLVEGDTVLWRATSDDAHPRIEAGDLVVLRRDTRPVEGDFVLTRVNGRFRLGLYHLAGNEVRLGFPRPELPPLRYPRHEFGCEGVVSGLIRTFGGGTSPDP